MNPRVTEYEALYRATGNPLHAWEALAECAPDEPLWASLRIMRGLPLMVAARVLGHSATRMVEKHHGHLAESYVRQAVEQTGFDLPPEP